ncbi:MAG: enolase C-terminal domain-like protein [Phycisphaerae bacterium]
MQRRDFMKLAGAAGTAGLLASAGGAWAQSGRKPAEAKEGEVRIEDVELYPAGRLYIRVVTDAGVDGWGEVAIFSRKIAAAIVETYRPLLIGMNPTRIEHIWQLLYRAHRNMRGGLAFTSAIAGVDIALWDLLGKLTDRPLYSLLGGPCRDRIRCYPSKNAHKVTSHRLHKMVETPDAIDAVAADVHKTRQKLGKDGLVMVDGHGKFTAQVAIQLAKKIESADVLFFEEVVPPENNADLLRVKKATPVPLAVGERMSTIWSFRRPLEDKSADVLNPDIVEVGGVSQMHKLAGIAELFDLPLAPHSTHSALGLAASVHVCAAINNFLVHEAYSHIANSAKFLSPLKWGGEGTYVELPEGPGLGVKVDLDGVKEAAARAKKDGGLKKAYFLKDGSVADR